MESVVDLEKLKWKGQSHSPQIQRTEVKRFLRGPIPMSWFAKANRASSKSQAVSVGIVLWHLVFINRAMKVRVESIRMREMGISRYSLRRGLMILESEGLALVDRKKGRSPIVTIIGVPDWWSLETVLATSKNINGGDHGKA